MNPTHKSHHTGQLSRQYHFCKYCGGSINYKIPDDGDTNERAVCTQCHAIHYENPLNIVGTIPYMEDKVLLCKRNIEPRKGKWTLPAGFMELGESLVEGAVRETQEEAGAAIEIEGLHCIISIGNVSHVNIFYRAKLLNTNFNPGPETSEVYLFQEKDIPWNEIAFSTVTHALKLHFQHTVDSAHVKYYQHANVHELIIRN